MHIHCYRADEMATMLDLAKEFGFKIAAFHHGVEAYKIADRLAAKACAARCGPTGGASRWKPSTASRKTSRWSTARANGCAIVHSDSEEGIQRLNQEAAKAMAHAQPRRHRASRPNTRSAGSPRTPRRRSASIDQTGTLEPGKMADVVVWNGTPFSVYAHAEQVYVDGARVYDRNDPARQPKSDFMLGQPATAPGGVR